MDKLAKWIRTNWNDESNVGKAKLIAAAALIFILIAAVLPDSGQSPIPTPAPRSETDTEAAEKEAAAAYRDYEARVAELEQETQSGQRDAGETYLSYETRIAELERENRLLREQLVLKEQRVAALEQGAGPAEAANAELRLQLLAVRANLDELLKRLGEAGEP